MRSYVSNNTQLDRIENKIDKSSFISWFFGGFALFVAGMIFAREYEDPLSFMALFSLAIAILGCIILTVVLILWVRRSLHSR